ncbi:MAG TPA: tRNA pseudouridine(38-40) synthase TruA [Casimicrobiaceae bacterium]|nr:tRNA pseudouridine(38-40) synthase TruA [Casimicrobiaceae bacterium]
MRVCLLVEYDGRGFCGFQSQPSRCGVQDALEQAIGAIAGTQVSVAPAGRTDAGVHATAQIVHFDVAAERPGTAWVRGVNSHLPSSAAVLWSMRVADSFHSRFAAMRRHYTYLLQNRRERAALHAGKVGWYHHALDVAAMREASAALVGTHDFSSFRAAECQARSPVKTLSRLDIARHGDWLRFDFSADAFLHHMIRNVVGALVYVGAHRQPAQWIATLLHARDRTQAAPTFAPDGLYFTGADYPAEFDLPSTRREIAWPA